MTLHSFAQLLAYAGSVLGVWQTLPQIRRIVANPHLPGVSPWTWSVTATGCTIWLVYGIRSHSVPQIPGNALMIIAAVTIVLLVPVAWSRRRRAVTLLGTIGVLVAASTTVTPMQVGLAGFALSLTAIWPQIYETVWRRRGMGPSSLSLTATSLAVGSQFLWLVYAALSGDRPVLIAAVVGTSGNLLITLTEARRRVSVRGTVPARVDLQPDTV